jgi:hypothetical protein
MQRNSRNGPTTFRHVHCAAARRSTDFHLIACNKKDSCWIPWPSPGVLQSFCAIHLHLSSACSKAHSFPTYTHTCMPPALTLRCGGGGGGGCCSFLFHRSAIWGPGTAFTNFTIFLIKNPANFLVALLSGILPLACPLT